MILLTRYYVILHALSILPYVLIACPQGICYREVALDRWFYNIRPKSVLFSRVDHSTVRLFFFLQKNILIGHFPRLFFVRHPNTTQHLLLIRTVDATDRLKTSRPYPPDRRRSYTLYVFIFFFGRD